MSEHGSDITAYTPPGSTFGENAGSAIPVLKQFFSSRDAITDAMNNDEASWAAAINTVAADIINLGTEGVAAVANPLDFLVGVGLDFLFATVDWADKLFTWLTGDPGAMGDLIERWGQIKETLVALSEEVDHTWSSSLATSNDAASNAARDKVSGTAAAILGSASECASLQQLLGNVQILSTILYETVKSIVSTLVQKLVFYGLIALANSGWSFGSSIAAFLLKATLMSNYSLLKSTYKLQEAGTLSGKLLMIGQEVLQSTVRAKGKELLLWGLNTGSAAVSGLSMDANADYSSTVPSGGGGEIRVLDADEFDVCAEELRRLTTNADNIHSAAQDTGADFWTWGIGCIIFANWYEQDRMEIVEDAGLIAPALEGNAERFTACAEDIRSCEQEVVSSFETVGEGLD